ncbi:MAG: winged helix-turn-helix domain-containing protein [Planctomycetota bacterium]
MKATEIKYLFLLQTLAEAPRATHAELARAADIPPSLVNRYLKRLAGWKAVSVAGRGGRKYALTPKGKGLLRRASWAFLAFGAGLVGNLREGAISELRRHSSRKAVLYGATPLAGVIARWATEAGIEIVALCDEERRGRNVARLDDLAAIEYDLIILADWDRAGDRMLARLLDEFGEVINPFETDGAARPEWR